MATALGVLGIVLSAQNDYAGAEAHFTETVAILRKVLGDPHPEVAKAMSNVAITVARRGDRTAADALFEETVTRLEKSLGPDHPDTAIALASRAENLCEMGQPAAAQPLARRASSIFGRVFEAGHPALAEMDSVMGGCLATARRYEEAEPLLVRGHAALEAKVGAAAPETQRARLRLVRLYEAWSRPDEAAKYRVVSSAR